MKTSYLPFIEGTLSKTWELDSGRDRCRNRETVLENISLAKEGDVDRLKNSGDIKSGEK